MNDQIAESSRKRPLSIWDLPGALLTQPHNFRKLTAKRGRERKHQTAILAFIYRNRFATAGQVRRRFPEFLKSDRTTRRHLAEMQESLGLLDLVPTPSPLWPKVYSVSWRGMRKMTQAFRKKQPSWTPPVGDRRRIGYSIHHVYHELACTEFLLQVHEAAQSSGIELLETQRRSLVKNDAFLLPGGRLVPDGMFLLRSSKGMICTFLEIDTGTMPVKAVIAKLQRYASWSESDHGKAWVSEIYRRHGSSNPEARFRIAVICGDNHNADGERRLRALAENLDRSQISIQKAVWLSTVAAIRDAEVVSTDAIWRRMHQNWQKSKGPFLLPRH